MTEYGKERASQAPASPSISPRQTAQVSQNPASTPGCSPATSQQAARFSQNPASTPGCSSASELPRVISLPMLLQQPQAEPNWIVQGLLPVGVSLLAGPARVDKTLLANQLGLSVSRATPFLGQFPARQGRVLYLALTESDVQMAVRTLNLLKDQRSPDDFHLAFQWSPFRQGGLADLEDTVAWLDSVRLVIVDSLEFVQPLRGDSATYGYRGRPTVPAEAALTFFVPLRELARRYDLAILLLHHLPDDWPANRRDPLAGVTPTGLTAASTCNLLLNPRTSPHACELHVAGPQVPERRLPLAYDPLRGSWHVE